MYHNLWIKTNVSHHLPPGRTVSQVIGKFAYVVKTEALKTISEHVHTQDSRSDGLRSRRSCVFIFVEQIVIFPAALAERLFHNQHDNGFGQLKAKSAALYLLFSGANTVLLYQEHLWAVY